ncbi:hypothetical protein ACO0QE_002052 [Hanseniaspora vineae]
MSTLKPKIIPEKQPILQQQQTTPEQRFWRSFTSTQLIKEHNAVTDISFNPLNPYDFAVASSTRVQIFSSRTRQVIKTFNRFKDLVYSCNFRFDGKILATSDATGLISLYDSYNPRNLLLSIQPEKSQHATHVAKFNNMSKDPKLLYTANDDRHIRIYDISHSYQPLVKIGGNDDYVRTLNFLPNSPNLLMSGSYDGNVRIYDIRSNNPSTPIAKLNNEAPVEDVIAINATTVVSCGGPSFKVWDIQNSTSGNKLFERNNFSKTVTSLSYLENSAVDSDLSISNCLVASSLDGHVKVFDPMNKYQVKFGWKFSGPVLSCGISPNVFENSNPTTANPLNNGNAETNKHVVIGLSSGLLAIRTRKRKIGNKKININGVTRSSGKKSNAYNKMIRGSEYNGSEEQIVHNDKLTSTHTNTKLRAFERSLQSFKWSETLDNAFIPGMAKELTLTALQELRKRGKIRVALQNRDETSLEPLLNWCLKTGVEDIRSAPIVVDWLSIVLELYGDSINRSTILEELLISLKDRIRKEINRCKEAQKIEGMLQLLTNM